MGFQVQCLGILESFFLFILQSSFRIKKKKKKKKIQYLNQYLKNSNLTWCYDVLIRMKKSANCLISGIIVLLQSFTCITAVGNQRNNLTIYDSSIAETHFTQPMHNRKWSHDEP